MRIVDLIIKKKEGKELTKEEIHFLIDGYVKGEVPDYQISAFLMAVCFQGLSDSEQVNLTDEMLKSGEQIDLSNIDGICVDKHSTGGVGDKTTLVVAPILASCGLKMAKMSGRGLGHTGGTLDKLESIPGFTISVKPSEFFKQVSEVGIAVVGQTANITPADKKLYALRDVTGTVESVGLIASSIMSKKLASGASYILLDVKVGDGAFMKNLEDARVLAQAMVNIGNTHGRKTVAMLTDMGEPLGEAVGNSIEVIEAIETLKGKGPKKFQELCFELSSEMLLMTKLVNSKEEGLAKVKEVIDNGLALEKLKLMIEYQGGNGKVVNDYSLLPLANKQIVVKSKVEGYVKDINALEIGHAAMILGAGRVTKDDVIDLSVGIKVVAKVGDYVKENDPIAIIYANEIGIDDAVYQTYNAFVIVKERQIKGQIILDIVR